LTGTRIVKGSVPPVTHTRPDLHPAVVAVVDQMFEVGGRTPFKSTVNLEVALRAALDRQSGRIEDPLARLQAKSYASAKWWLIILGAASIFVAWRYGIPMLQAETSSVPANRGVTVSMPQQKTGGYEVVEGVQPVVGRPNEQQIEESKNFLGPHWTVAAVSPGAEVRGAFALGARQPGVLVFQRESPCRITSLSFRIQRPDGPSSLELQLRDRSGSAKLVFFSVFRGGNYPTTCVVPGALSIPPFNIPGQAVQQGQAIHIADISSGLRMRTTGSEGPLTINGLHLDGIQTLQLLVPAATLAQHLELQDVHLEAD
jgi:hypothetical protein